MTRCSRERSLERMVHRMARKQDAEKGEKSTLKDGSCGTKKKPRDDSPEESPSAAAVKDSNRPEENGNKGFSCTTAGNRGASDIIQVQRLLLLEMGTKTPCYWKWGYRS